MAFYKERIISWLIHLSLRQRMLAPYRDRVVSSARGRVLEVGGGRATEQPQQIEAPGVIVSLAHAGSNDQCEHFNDAYADHQHSKC